MTLRRPIRSPRKPAITAPKRKPEGRSGSDDAELGRAQAPLGLHRRKKERDDGRVHPVEGVAEPTHQQQRAVRPRQRDPVQAIPADSSCGPFGCRRRLWASRSPVPGTLLDQIHPSSSRRSRQRSAGQAGEQHGHDDADTLTGTIAAPPSGLRQHGRHDDRVVRLLPLRHRGRPGLPRGVLPRADPVRGYPALLRHPVRRLRRPADRCRDLRPLRRPDRSQGARWSRPCCSWVSARS